MEKKPDIIQSFIKLGCKCSNNGYHLYDIQKWLREVKGVDIVISPQKSKEAKKYIVSVNMTFIRSNGKLDYTYKLFNTYEEALEAGIYEAYYLLNN